MTTVISCLNCENDFKDYKSKSRKYCSTECSIAHKKSLIFKQIEKNGFHKNYRQVKAYLIHKNGNVCSICGFNGYWNGKPITLIADHINGRSNDNRVSNMRLVCPMCDSQLDTYKSKNKNSDRKR